MTMSVVIETSIGDFTLDLFTKERPKACYNFLKLCKIRYYNYCLIFEINKNLAIRTGDPTNIGDGGESIYSYTQRHRSNPKKYFSAEDVPKIEHNRRGLISMINNGHSKHGSQFLITLANNLDSLDRQGHTVFGEIVEGLEILNKFDKTLVDDKCRPYRDICISHTVILHDPYVDPDSIKSRIRRRSPDIPRYLIESERVGIYDDLDQEESKSREDDSMRQEAKEKAILLEILGDLPSADAKPAENVLFICRLNSLTCEQDLERIFARFGNIRSVKIVKDSKSGHSLGYGFIEFSSKDECERAYFKMDNALIDDRRIHVDFSQSVAKQRSSRRY